MKLPRCTTSLLVLVFLPLPVMAQAGTQGFRIAGMLTSSSSGVPIAHGHLSASRVSEEGQIAGGRSDLVTDSDEHGRFVISVPSAGDWQLSASARGFHSQPFDEHEGYFTGVILTVASPSMDVVFQLTPEASISGYILDEAGDPVRTNGQVTLLMATEKLPDEAQSPWQTHGATRTDDRGHYEFTNLAPGRYQVMVQAQPWYAETNVRRAPAAPNDTSSAPSLDPALDVAYPLTFYPGVTDPAAASTLTLRGGDNTEADLRLLPVSSVHLRIPIPPATEGSDRRNVGFPLIQQILPSGGLSFQQTRPSLAGEGFLDVGGLAPGSYEVTPQGSDGHPSLLHIDAGSPKSLELTAATPETSLTVLFDLPSGTSTPPIQFVNAETGRVNFLGGGYRGGEGFRGGQLGRSSGPAALRHRSRDPGNADDEPQTVQLVPGRYEVRLSGNQGQNLTGMTSAGAEVSGRYLTIHGGSPKVTLHIAVGHAVVAGIIALEDKPDAGAMVLLVPATLGDPQGLTILRRDQSDSDGSFRIRDVIPGRYILLAIDHGWQVNWRDPSTLSRYLVHGVPIDLTVPRSLQQNIAAQLP